MIWDFNRNLYSDHQVYIINKQGLGNKKFRYTQQPDLTFNYSIQRKGDTVGKQCLL